MIDSLGLRLELLTWQDVSAEIQHGTPVALPVGAIEQHGPHLPLGTDAFIAHGLLMRLAQRRRIVVAPPLLYAAYSRPRSGGGRSFAGSTGIPDTVLQDVVAAIVGDWMRQGFRRVLVLNGHLENAWSLMPALERAIEPFVDTHRVVYVNWWELVTLHELQEIFEGVFPGWEAEHASITETSIMEAMHPETVRADLKGEGGAPRAIAYDVFPTPPDTIWPTGVGHSAVSASPELGRHLIDILIQHLMVVVDGELT